MALILASLLAPASMLPIWLTPLLLILAQPAFAAGAARVLGYELEDGYFGLLLRRGPVLLLWLLLYGALVGALVAWPLQLLLQTRTPLLALALSCGFLVSIVAALRLWPAIGLAMIWDDAWFNNGDRTSPWRALDRSAAFALHVTGKQGDRHFGAGVLVALALIVLTLACIALALRGHGLAPAWLPQEWRLPSTVVMAVLLAPTVHLLVLWQTAALLTGPEDDDAVQTEIDYGKSRAEPLQLTPDWGGHGDASERKPTPPIADPEPADRSLALLNAAATGNIAQAMALLEAGADANVAPGPNDRDQRSALCIAATLSDIGLLRALIARGADPNLAVNGITALHAATRDSLHGRPDAVMTLIANGGRPDRIDHDGRSPLHHAALSEDPTIAAMLLDAGAPLDLVNRDGLSALAIAARAGNEAVLRLLLERGAQIEAPRGMSALIAAASGHADRAPIIKRLLKAKAQVGAVDKLGRQALHAAALHGHGDCADALIAAGADVNARDAHGVTPLMEAARAGANRVLARLVFRKPDPTPVDGQGRGALHLACASKQANLETINTLLALGIDIQARSKDGRRALDIASQAGRWDLVAAIDPDAPRPTTLDANVEPGEPAPAHGERERLLLESLRLGHVHVAAELLGLEPPLPDEVLLRAFRIALERDDLAALQMMVTQGFSPIHAPLDDSEALQMAARLRPVPIRCVSALLGFGASPTGAGVLLPLLANAADGEAGATDALDALALLLLDRGADPFARISGGASALHLALRAGLLRTALALIARGCDPNAADHSGQTALHLLMRLPRDGRDGVLLALIRAGADPERSSADGETPLGRATLMRRNDAMPAA